MGAQCAQSELSFALHCVTCTSAFVQLDVQPLGAFSFSLFTPTRPHFLPFFALTGTQIIAPSCSSRAAFLPPQKRVSSDRKCAATPCKWPPDFARWPSSFLAARRPLGGQKLVLTSSQKKADKPTRPARSSHISPGRVLTPIKSGTKQWPDTSGQRRQGPNLGCFGVGKGPLCGPCISVCVCERLPLESGSRWLGEKQKSRAAKEQKREKAAPKASREELLFLLLEPIIVHNIISQMVATNTRPNTVSRVANQQLESSANCSTKFSVNLRHLLPIVRLKCSHHPTA